MSKFSDLLNQTLPSASFFESDDDTDNVNDNSNDSNNDTDDNSDVEKEYGDEELDMGSDDQNECGDNSIACEDDDDDNDDDMDDLDDDDEDEFDPEELSDAELAALDADLGGDTINNIADADDAEKVELDPNEEREADDMMGVAATAVLINDEMSSDEKKELAESTRDVQIAINEGLLLESDIDTMLESVSMDEIFTEGRYDKKMLIRLDKNAKMKQLFSLGVNVSASAHRDPDYIKYKKVLRMRKILKARLTKKYHAEAMKRMKIYFKRLNNSKSNILSKLAKKVSK